MRNYHCLTRLECSHETLVIRIINFIFSPLQFSDEPSVRGPHNPVLEGEIPPLQLSVAQEPNQAAPAIPSCVSYPSTTAKNYISTTAPIHKISRGAQNIEPPVKNLEVTVKNQRVRTRIFPPVVYWFRALSLKAPIRRPSPRLGKSQVSRRLSCRPTKAPCPWSQHPPLHRVQPHLYPTYPQRFTRHRRLQY